MTDKPTVAVFRPDDERLAEAIEFLEAQGVEPIADPMLAIEATGERPREDADYTILTSKTGVELAAEAGWKPGGRICAIGPATADALREAGYEVAIVPEEYTSSGLVDHLASDVDGARVEVARSDHGAQILLDGLEAAGAYVHETILYQLVRPPGSGVSAERAADGTLDAALFTSSLTVEYFLDAAGDRGIRADAIEGLDDATVGVIGEPTEQTATDHGIAVDVVPPNAEFEELAELVLTTLPSEF